MIPPRFTAASSAERPVRSVLRDVEPGYPAENERVMRDPGEIGHFHERCSDLMRELLSGLAAYPEIPRPFPEVEDEMDWPRRRIASVLGGVSRLRHAEFGGRRPYHFLAPRLAASHRWEIWMDAVQARAVDHARAADASARRAQPALRRAVSSSSISQVSGSTTTPYSSRAAAIEVSPSSDSARTCSADRSRGSP
jgi:hypothetical protein